MDNIRIQGLSLMDICQSMHNREVQQQMSTDEKKCLMQPRSDVNMHQTSVEEIDKYLTKFFSEKG